MTVQLPDSLERLARANPVQPDDELGKGAVAQAALERILATEGPAAASCPRRRPRRHGRGLAIVLIAALLLAVGGAVAATDPLGLFRSPNPGSAIYGVATGRHVTPPTVQQIGCPDPKAQTIACGAHLSGQRYTLIDHVFSNPTVTRPMMLAAIRRERRAGQISPAGATRLDTDIAAVSDEFIARFNVMMHFGSYSSGDGSGRVPPVGVPSLLVCQTSGQALSCRDLNGDDSAPVGGGIYAAVPAPDWRPAPPQQPDSTWGLEVAILGHPPTAAELRFEIDLVRYGTTSHSSSSASSASPRRASAAPEH